MSDIVGIDNVLSGASTTISGISVSNDKSKVSITIKRPSGDFLNRLTLVFSCVVPENTPLTELKKPYPTAGSYTILLYPTITPDSSGNTHSGLTLVRNLVYPFWLSSQSAGEFFFVNYKFGVLNADQYPAVLAGTYDIGGYEDSQLPDLINNHPGNTKTIAATTLDYLSLDQSRWPFCDRHLRRAMNFGIDRSGEANFLLGSLAPLVVTLTDTYLPPSIPGANPTNGSVYPLNGSGMSSAKAEMDAFFANPSANCAPPNTWVSGTKIPLKLVISGLSQTGKTNGFELANRINTIKATNGVGFDAKVYCAGDTINPMVNSTDACVGKNLNSFFATLPADYDVASRGWIEDYSDPFDFLNALWGNGSPYNYGLYFNSVISPALDAAGLLAPPARYTTYAGLNIDLAQDGAAVALWIPNSIFLFSNRIDPNSIGPYPDYVIRDLRLKH